VEAASEVASTRSAAPRRLVQLGPGHWTALGAPPGTVQLVDLQFSSAADGWALAENVAGNPANRLFSTSDGGRTRTAVTPPDPIRR
jgi:hypothetical protein